MVKFIVSLWSWHYIREKVHSNLYKHLNVYHNNIGDKVVT